MREGKVQQTLAQASRKDMNRGPLLPQLEPQGQVQPRRAYFQHDISRIYCQNYTPLPYFSCPKYSPDFVSPSHRDVYPALSGVELLGWFSVLPKLRPVVPLKSARVVSEGTPQC